MLVLFLLALSGLYFGYLLGKATQEELALGKILFAILELLILSTLTIILILADFHLFSYAFGILLGVFLPFTYIYLGLAAISVTHSQNLTLSTTILAFLYGLPTGSMLFHQKAAKKLVLHTLLYVLPLIISIFATTFISLAAGALTSIILRDAYHALPHRNRTRRRTRPHPARH